MADAKNKRTRMVSAGLIIFLIITAHRPGHAADQSSNSGLIVEALSALARLPVVLRVFVVAATTGR
jgi:hypothetical protein